MTKQQDDGFASLADIFSKDKLLQARIKAAPPRTDEGGLSSLAEIIRKDKPLRALTKPQPPRIDEVIDPKDVGYTHPVFVQCFLPTRHTEKNKQWWQTNCGRASLVVRAGFLTDPAKRHQFKQCTVPAGSKARFVVAYVNDQLQRHKRLTIDMGKSLRKAMQSMDIPVGGKNGEALMREVENFAAAEIAIGVWDADGHTHQHRALVAPHVSFWLEKDPQQGTLWQPEMTVSTEYAQAVWESDRLTPFYWPAMIALQHDTRAMDIHAFLVYRLRNGLKHDVPLHATTLHGMFGQDVQQLDHFWARFLLSLQRALRWYPEAVIQPKNDCIILRKTSRPLIPYRKMHRLGV